MRSLSAFRCNVRGIIIVACMNTHRGDEILSLWVNEKPAFSSSQFEKVSLFSYEHILAIVSVAGDFNEIHH